MIIGNIQCGGNRIKMALKTLTGHSLVLSDEIGPRENYIKSNFGVVESNSCESNLPGNSNRIEFRIEWNRNSNVEISFEIINLKKSRKRCQVPLAVNNLF